MKWKFTILAFFLINMLYAQKDSGRENKFCIEISPLALVDFVDQPSYQIGTEIKLYKNVTLYFAGGGYFPGNGIDQNRLTNLEGYNARLEIKYYLNKKADPNGREYISIEGFYKKESYNWQDSIHLTPSYLTTFGEFKTVYCCNLNYGILWTFKSKIVIDFYVGIGLRFKNITSTLTPIQANALQYSENTQYDTEQLGYSVYPGGKDILPNIDLGFKIGYQIK